MMGLADWSARDWRRPVWRNPPCGSRNKAASPLSGAPIPSLPENGLILLKAPLPFSDNPSAEMA